MANPEDLLKHAGWLRGLARTLVADAQAADDLVQDTWVAALREPPRGEPRPWLGRVLRNAARARFRGEGRRVRRERAAAHYEVLPSADELAARMELQRTLVDVVLGLDEPYRSTIVLRFYEGLSAAEIARRRGLPGATVRSHLKRGLDEMRRRLDEGHAGGRAAWSAICLPWLSTKPALATDPGAAATTLFLGALTMSTGAKLALGAAAVTLTLVSYRLTTAATDGAGRLQPPAESTPSPSASLAEPREEPAPLARSARSAVPSTPVLAAPPAVESVPHVVSARVVDEQLAPLAGAVLRITRLDASSEPTKPDGEVRLELSVEDGGRYGVEVGCAGYATKKLATKLDVAGPTDLGQIVLLPGGRILGVVVDEDDRPVAGADVVVTPRASSLNDLATRYRVGPDRYLGVFEQRTDADGRFSFDGVVADGRVRVWAGAPRSLWTASEPFAVYADGEPVELKLGLERLGPDEIVEGIVLSPDGVPVGGCAVRRDYRSPTAYFTRWVTTGADGRFEFPALGVGRTDLRAEDPDERWSDAVLTGAEAGGELVLRFREPRFVDVRVEDAHSIAVPEATVQAIARFEHDSQGVGRAVPDELERGVHRLREPAERFSLQIAAPGHADLETEAFQPGELPDSYVVRLTKLPGLTGRVWIGEQPAAGVRLQLARALVEVGDGFQVVYHRGFLTELDPYARFEVETDEEGRFQLFPQEPGDYAIRAAGRDGLAPAELRVADYDPAVGRRGLELHLTRGGNIEGEIVPRPGTEVAGLQVVASRGDGHIQVQRVGADGLFLFERLIPGRWNVEVVPDDLSNLPTSHFVMDERVELPWVCEVFEGETTFHDIDLASVEPCVVTGALVVDGEPAAGWTATLRTRAGHSHRPSEHPWVLLGAEGRFELSVDKPRAYTLTLQAPQGEPELAVAADLDLAPGALEWELAFETGAAVIDGVTRAESHTEFLFLEWVAPNGAHAVRRLEPDPDGRCRVDRFPAGAVSIRRGIVNAWEPNAPAALVEGHLPVGGTASLEIP